MSEAKARELWRSLESCLPSRYRTLEWDKLPAMVQQDMSRTIAQFIFDTKEQERDRVWAKVFRIYNLWLDFNGPPAELGESLRSARLRDGMH